MGTHPDGQHSQRRHNDIYVNEVGHEGEEYLLDETFYLLLGTSMSESIPTYEKTEDGAHRRKSMKSVSGDLKS